ncbi:MAG: DNA-protecting protein DprA [Clostridiales bacterium]|nr:DNA-protecting protein DprA [Clostridiales bacterium]
MTRDEYNYWLCNLPNIGPRKIKLLRETFGNSEQIYKASRNELEKAAAASMEQGGTRLSDTDINTILLERREDKIRKDFWELQKRNISFITIEDERYPERLKQIYDAPFALYVRGKLHGEKQKAIAVVGARNCTEYGKEIAKYLASALSREGITIISGLARGIDSCAHQGALRAGGLTYAVLGCGIDICYPKENINLYMEIIKEGALLSEYAPGTQPFSGNFPMRNRIISGLSDGIIVVEAKNKSGSLITVDMGLEQGKEIYVVPGRITDRLSEGCNNLIKMGAKLITSPEDILEDLFINYNDTNLAKIKKIEEEIKKTLEPEERIVYDCLGLEPKYIEEIAFETNLPIDQLMEHLLTLELKDIIDQTSRNYYKTKIPQ